MVSIVSFRCGFFFFQAEDGIRELVRSRGLGDVYKRQPYSWVGVVALMPDMPSGLAPAAGAGGCGSIGAPAVSYTHLTLPTSELGEISVGAVSLKKKRWGG